MSNTGMDAWYGQVVGAAERQEREAREREHAEAVEAIRGSGAGYGRELDDYDVAEMRRGGLRPNEVAGEFLRRYARTGGARDLSSGERIMSPASEAPDLFPPVERTIPSEAEIAAGGVAAGAQAVARSVGRGVYEFGRGVWSFSADVYEALGGDPEKSVRPPSYEEIGGAEPSGLAESIVSSVVKYGIGFQLAHRQLSGLADDAASMAGRVLQTGARTGTAGAVSDILLTDPREGLVTDAAYAAIRSLYGADAEAGSHATPIASAIEDGQMGPLVGRLAAAAEGLVLGAVGGWALKGAGAAAAKGADVAGDAARALWLRADEIEETAVRALARSRHQLNAGLDPASVGWLTTLYTARIAKGAKKLTKDLLNVAASFGATPDQAEAAFTKAAKLSQKARAEAGEQAVYSALEGFVYRSAMRGDLSYSTYKNALVDKLGLDEAVARKIWEDGASRAEREHVEYILREPLRTPEPTSGLSGMELLQSKTAVPTSGSEGSKKLTAQQFHEMAKERVGGVARNHDESPENIEAVARFFAREAEMAARQPGSAAPWYRVSIDTYHELAAEEFPTILSNPQHRIAFDFATAVTSNGETVTSNTSFARRAFRYYLENGRFPETINSKRSAAMVEAFRLWNVGMEKMGPERWQRFLHTEFTGPQFSAMGFNVTVQPGKTLPGSAVLGQKIGASFFQNLEGNFWRSTKDLWYRRTFGRATGAVMNDSPELIASRSARLRETVAADPKSAELLKTYTGLDSLDGLSDEELFKASADIFSGWAGNKAGLGKGYHLFDPAKGATHPTDEFHRAARELNKLVNGPVDAPDDIEARIMDAAAERAVELLRERGYDTTPADMQALLWYWEQRLWRRTGIDLKSDTDYPTELARVLRREGAVDEQTIERVLRAGRRRIERAGGDATGGDALGSRTRLAGLGDDGRRAFIRDWRADDFRARVRDGAASPGGGLFSERGESASVHALTPGGERKSSTPKGKVWGPADRAYANAVESAGIKFPTFVEPPPSEQTGRAMVDAMDSFDESTRARILQEPDKRVAAKMEAARLSVSRYSAEELAQMRVFMTEDGRAGFALNGDDIVSVFKAPESDIKDYSMHALAMAVQAGGRKLDNFDGPLTRLHARAGFRPVARTPFDLRFKPDGWDARRHGKPDILFMVYDPTYDGTKVAADKIPSFASYDEAAAHRDSIVEQFRGDTAPEAP